MKLQKTIKLPVSKEITEEKLYKLDRVTARLTYGVDLFLNRIIDEDITTRARANRYNREIQELTGLSSGFVQCCRDKALWMYKSYKSNYREWEKKVAKLEEKINGFKSEKNGKKLKRKLYRLRKREPSPPKVTNKIPILFDQRVGSVSGIR